MVVVGVFHDRVAGERIDPSRRRRRGGGEKPAPGPFRCFFFLFSVDCLLPDDGGGGSERRWCTARGGLPICNNRNTVVIPIAPTIELEDLHHLPRRRRSLDRNDLHPLAPFKFDVVGVSGSAALLADPLQRAVLESASGTLPVHSR